MAQRDSMSTGAGRWTSWSRNTRLPVASSKASTAVVSRAWRTVQPTLTLTSIAPSRVGIGVSVTACRMR